jgi:hypothetical protein
MDNQEPEPTNEQLIRQFHEDIEKIEQRGSLPTTQEAVQIVKDTNTRIDNQSKPQ